MKCIKNISLLWLIAAVACAGCVKEVFPGNVAIPSGKTDVKFNIVFEPIVSTEVMTRATDAPEGDAINDIEDLCVLLFNKDGSLADNGIREVKRGDMNFEVIPDYETDRHAVFTVKDVPYGEFYMFAAANLGKTVKTSTYPETSTTFEVLETLRGKGELASMDDLKAIRLVWDPEAIVNNAEMLGFFTMGEAPAAPSAIDKAAPVLIDRSSISLHSWLRRAASKVTIEFDPSGLRNNIRVYLKSARLRHIPLYCPLGDENVPAGEEELVPDELTPYYHIDYYPEESADNHETWMALARGGILDGMSGSSIEEYDGMHTAKAKALYFYENMQGTGKDKAQDSDGNGELDYPGHNTDPADPGYKDQKPYGTYVEIEGHYVSNAPGNYGQGRIFYRFMLGKDARTDYNAERNNHYKLTLKFRGNANDVDWHIDYTPESDILYAPDPYYISYLYNQSMNLPLYISGRLKENDHIDLHIKKNGWGPSDPDTLKKMYPFTLYSPADDPECNGFLSLKPMLNANGVLADLSPGADYKSTYNKTYWYSNGLGLKTISYNELKTAVENEGVVNVPLYTREKQLVKQTAFTGNNIYPQYRREAILEVSGVIGGKEIEPKEIKILQMRRIINPSGVFRNSDNTTPFELTMAFRTSPQASEFQPLHSIGPWRAKINVGTGWEIVDAVNGVISGDDGSPISFKVCPVSEIGKDETRCAYVDIEYNNYTCVHRVILRQGDVPLALTDDAGARKWYYYNLRTKDKLADLPMDEGSLFRYCNADQPISSANQTDESVGTDSGSMVIEGGGTIPWTSIGGTYNGNGFSGDTFLGGTAEVANFADYGLLYSSEGVEFKFGILYGNDAIKTEMDAGKAVGYNKYNNPDAKNGMRGIFVYNLSDARSVFFPVGCTGMGRRKDNGPNELDRRGVLRYAQRSPESRWGEGLANYAPLFYYIHEFEGAIYWLNKEVVIPEGFSDANGTAKANAWDINFRTFDFNHFSSNAASSTKCDAGFIRCVVK